MFIMGVASYKSNYQMLQCESDYKTVPWSHTTHTLVYRIYIRLGVLKLPFLDNDYA